MRLSHRNGTAVATLLTFCPPGPVAARKRSSNASSGMTSQRLISTGIVHSSGKTRILETGRKRRCHVDDRTSLPARDDQPAGVQQHRPPARAVNRVAGDRGSKAGRGMHEDLVRPTGQRAEFDAGATVTALQYPPARWE